jgi:hypothetical protein
MLVLSITESSWLFSDAFAPGDAENGKGHFVEQSTWKTSSSKISFPQLLPARVLRVED